jgi:TolB-like protein/tetratricopeptide (TPR) repeat protein
MADVFVSYKAEDRRPVKRLVSALEADDYSVWWDAHISGGAAWRDAIEAELSAAKCVIVVWSEKSVGVAGSFVRDEASRAMERGAYLPVQIDSSRPPLGFGERQAISLAGWNGKPSDPRYQALLAAIREMAGHRAGPMPPPRSASFISRRVVVGGGTAAVVAAGVGGWLLWEPSKGAAADAIAVLPFANLSGDPRQTYFSDGIAEELRSGLARVAGLRVVGRTSSEAVRNEDAETAAKKLGVSNILTGSVRQTPATIRITAELVDGKTGLSRWSQDYNRTPGDAINIQMDIAENVVRALSITLGKAAQDAIAVGSTRNVAAQKLVFQAEQLARTSTKDSWEQAISLLTGAISLDPAYADAYARKALLTTALANRYSHGAAEMQLGRNEGLTYARRSIAIAAQLPNGHLALGYILASNSQLVAALAEYRRAFDLAPGNPEILRRYSNFLGVMGKLDNALILANRAVTLDPLNPASHANRLRILFWQRRYPEVVDSAQRLRLELPQPFSAQGDVASCLTLLGRTAEAKHVLEQMPRDEPFRLSGQALLAVRTGDRAGAMANVVRMNELYGDAAIYQIAEIHAQLGNVSLAFASLDHAWKIKDGALGWLKVDPWLDPLRRDPRYSALVRKIGFPPA